MDTNSAFRKRNKEKMKLRKKPKYEIDAYHKMHDLRKESVNVLNILQDVFKREEYKKKLLQIDEMNFDISFENALKERSNANRNQKNDIEKLKIFSFSKVL